MNPTPENHSESFKLAQRLLRVVDTITKIIENCTPDDTGQLRLNQIRTMFLLGYEPGLVQKDVAQRLQITPAAVSTTVRDLEGEGLVERQPDPSDARQIKLYLSERGEKLIAEGEKLRCAAVARMLNALPIEEQHAIVEALERALEITRENGS